MSDIDKTVVMDPNRNNFEHCPVCNTEMQPDPANARDLRCPACNYIRKQSTIIAPGSVVCNKYRVLSSLGEGGFGDIFICHPLDNMAERYVLKVLKRTNANSVKRFRREARVLASITNEPRIVKIIDFWEEDNCMLIVMEYVRGMTLKQAKSQYLFDEPAVWQIAREILIALRHLWQIHSIIHRDIKPENIMLDEDFCVKLLDFGLSKACSKDGETAITLGNISLGTPGYMGPELFKDSLNADFRTDIFSVGATLFFLLTGSAPFKGDNLQQCYEDTLRNSPPAPENLEGVCSPRGIAILRKMMAREPQDRYRSYDELFAEVNALLKELE